jgi:hypothetical protein
MRWVEYVACILKHITIRPTNIWGDTVKINLKETTVHDLGSIRFGSELEWAVAPYGHGN